MGGGLALATKPAENHDEWLLCEQVLYREEAARKEKEKRGKCSGGKSDRVYSKLRSRRSGTRDSKLQP